MTVFLIIGALIALVPHLVKKAYNAISRTPAVRLSTRSYR